jgi:hypothetical protein
MWCVRKPWWMDRAQRWRWRHWHLWVGGGFDANDTLQVCEYAVRRLRPLTREVFLRHRVDAQDYRTIAQHLRISVREVERRMVCAICKYCQTVALIKLVRPQCSPQDRAAKPHVAETQR